jgi:hypothetical protein
MKSESARLFRVFVTVVGLTAVGCYSETSALRIPVRSPTTTLACGELADQVFFDAGYLKVTASMGAMVYTPRGPAQMRAPLPFHWAIGVWIPHPETSASGGPCDYELQALSADPSCTWVQCPLTPQAGAQYDEATREMAQRLRSAGAAAVSMSRPGDAD